ncbi:hypothetical protein PHAVU_003G250550 [Phaseolus vulgaris]
MFLGDINSEIERAGISTEATGHESFAVSSQFKTKKIKVYSVLESRCLSLSLIFSLISIGFTSPNYTMGTINKRNK